MTAAFANHRHAMRTELLAILAIVLASPCLAQDDPPLLDHPVQQVEDAEIRLTQQELDALGALFPEGPPNLLSPGAFARKYSLPAGIKPHDAKKPLPTALNYADGPVKFGMKTSVAPNTYTPSLVPTLPDPNVLGGAAGGTGEINSRVTYSADGWEFYGGRTFGVTQSDGAPPALSDRTTIGSSYKLPDWLAGGKLSSSIEFADTHEDKTRVEYRQPLGPAEGYIAAERQFQRGQFDSKEAPASVHGGVTRKF